MRPVRMSRRMPIENVDQRLLVLWSDDARENARRRRRRDARRDFFRRAAERTKKIADRFRFCYGVDWEAKAKSALDAQDQFGSGEAVDPKVLLKPAGQSDGARSGALGMKLAHEFANDGEKRLFRRTLLVRRRIGNVSVRVWLHIRRLARRREFAMILIKGLRFSLFS